MTNFAILMVTLTILHGMFSSAIKLFPRLLRQNGNFTALPGSNKKNLEKLTQILALDGAGVERHEQIVAGLAQLLDSDGRRAAYDRALVVLENRPKDHRRYALGYLVLAALVRLGELDARAEHAAEHRVRVCREQGRVHHESEKEFCRFSGVEDLKNWLNFR